MRERIAFRFAWNEDEVVVGFHEVAKIGFRNVPWIEIAMHQDLRCRQRTKQAGEFAAEASWKSIDDEAGWRGSLNFFNRISARKFNGQFWVQDDKIKCWKGALNLSGEGRIRKDTDFCLRDSSCQCGCAREMSPATA